MAMRWRVHPPRLAACAALGKRAGTGALPLMVRAAIAACMKHALNTTRQANFALWYQEVIAEADLAEESGVRGCMVIKPWGYGIWERIQKLMDAEIKLAGVENCYFPLLIPLSYFEKEADHVDGFAKEMAVVTHHRLVKGPKGGLIPDPESKLEEPLVVRPTSETVIGAAMARWIQSWRDLPMLTNQWANVMRWEMRTRMFLRTSEFLWQEGHTAHADKADAMAETLRALEMYRAFAEGALAMPVVAGEKPENERFPGAVATYSIEAMMQDGKALQAGTSHYLGTGFAESMGIKYQDKDGGIQHAHTTSWGVSTRMIGGVIMTHGDDDGLRCPPQIAPQQVVIVPMLRDDEGDAAVLDYCRSLAAELRGQSAFGEPLRVLLDTKATKAQTKRWSWVKKGAPIIVEIGPRDVGEGKAAVIRRDKLYQESGKLATAFTPRAEFVSGAGPLLEEIQAALYAEAKARLDSNIARDVTDLAAHFKGDEAKFAGWVEVQWSRPTGEALAKIVEQLKALKLTMRNTPMDAAPADGVCFFTGEKAVERVLVGRTY
jgi:prolyl-tRNA synthetase